VGDGLMSQIPALLISVAMGMIVTRSASESNLNTEVVKQFLSQPMVLIIAGASLLLLMIIGFPPIQVIIASTLLIGIGITFLRKQQTILTASEQAAMPPTEEISSEASFYKNIDNVYGLLSIEQVEMEFGYSLIPLVDESSGGSFIDRVVMFRKQFALEMGMVIPSVRLKDSGQLNPNQYAIKFKGEQVAMGDVLMDHYLALAPAETAEPIEGIDTIEPAFGIPAKWISEDKKAKAELAGYTLIDPTSVIITHLSEVIKAHAAELLNQQEVNNILANFRKTNEAIVTAVIPSVVSISELQKVLCNLLRENIPIRDMETILETLGDYGTSIKDSDMLTEYVRQALKRTISRRFTEANQLKVITLDAQIENLIMGAVKKMDNGSYLALEPQVIQNIITATTDQINKFKELLPTTIILTSPIVRIYFKKLVDQFLQNITVISFNEIDSDVQIQSLGNISIDR
ncbi:MAG: flagellar biosynthesis protein FlhA, partial [Hydrogenoanaerobacterium sp.]